MTVALYLDDDIGLLPLLAQAAQLGLAILRSDDVGMRGASDADHLDFATAKNMVLVSCNWRDYQRLHAARLERDEPHAGILMVSQWIPRGERVRMLLFRASTGEPGDFANQFIWLKDWG